MNKPGMYFFKTLVSPWSLTPWFHTQIYLKLFSKPRLQLVSGVWAEFYTVKNMASKRKLELHFDRITIA